MKEYSVKFPVPAFTDYPRTVKGTVDWLAANAEIERSVSPDFYVFGESPPSPTSQSKTWVHYPNSPVVPPIPGTTNPSLPSPQPFSYFPGPVKTISTLGNITLPKAVYFDQQTQNCFVSSSPSRFSTATVLYHIKPDLTVVGIQLLGGWEFRTIENIHVRRRSDGTIILMASEIIAIQGFPQLVGFYFYALNSNQFGSFNYSLSDNWSFPYHPVFINTVTLSNPFNITGISTPVGLVNDSSNNLYTVMTASTNTGTRPYISKMPPGGGASITLDITSFPPSYDPNDTKAEGIAVNSSGQLVLLYTKASENSPRYVGVINTTGGTLTEIAGPLNLGGNLPPFILGNIGIDSSNNIFIPRNNRVYKVTPTGTESVEAGTGSAGYVDGPYLSSQFNNPLGVFVSPSNNLYVADFDNYKVRATSGATNLFSAVQVPDYIAINGNVPYTLQIQATNSPTSYSASNLPAGLAVDINTGIISGTPSAPGTTSSVLQATNSFGGSSKGVIFEVFTNLPTDYYNLPTLRRAVGGGWWEFSGFERGDLLLAPSDQEILFPWGESNKSYDLTIWGEPIFQVPVLPAPPSGFKYKYYIGAKVSSSSGGPVLSP